MVSNLSGTGQAKPNRCISYSNHIKVITIHGIHLQAEYAVVHRRHGVQEAGWHYKLGDIDKEGDQHLGNSGSQLSSYLATGKIRTAKS